MNTPTRGGNWHVINGKLVDLNAAPQTEVKPAEAVAVAPEAEGDVTDNENNSLPVEVKSSRPLSRWLGN